MTTAHAQTRAEIQAKIVVLRRKQRRLPDAFARKHDAAIEELIDQLLALEPEPA